MIPDRLQYSIKEAAEQLCISVATLDQLIARGDIKVRRLGKRLFVPKTELVRFVSRDTVESPWPQKVNGKTTRKFSSEASQ